MYRPRRSLSRLALPALLVAVAACGDNLAGGPDGPPAPDAGPECRAVTVSRRDFTFNLFGQLTGLRHEVAPGLGGAAADVLRVELYDSTTPGLGALATGTFDLATAPNDNLGTCQHCVWISVDDDPAAALGTIYYQTAGSITLTAVVDPLELVFAGELSTVVLREATVDNDGRSTLVDGGDCVSVTGLAFDTTPTPGQACTRAEDCGNALMEICDPATDTCGGFQCGDFEGCPSAGDICISQHPAVFEGACYATCEPGETHCDAGDRCVQFGVDPAFGICKDTGDGATGTACWPADNSTSCTGAAVCSFETETCAEVCEFYAASPGCPDGSACSLFGVCEAASIGDPAGFGETCGPSAELATGCADDGDAFRGFCFGYFEDDPLICEEACFAGLGCDAGEFCALRFSSGLGICRPNPVCGDGALGEIDEVCDDGNTASGDGCSGDCQTVEYDVICAGLPALGVDATVTGDTATATDGFFSSCQFGFARAELWELTPPGPGRLRLRMTSATDQLVAVRGVCDDDDSELACEGFANAGETEEAIVQITDPTPGPVTVLVAAGTILEEGPFTLETDFVAQQCGDGIVAGAETCDDGNTTSNDGCRGDCLAIEYGFYCTTAPVLSTTAVNTGDTTGAPYLYENDCSHFEATGRDRLYRYTAPSAGTLSLRLHQGTNDLAIAAFTGCGPPATMTQLACSSVVDVEEIDLELTAGQQITIVVDGFDAEDAGPYELNATFTP
jgi:cysteine-rich repeat protein